MRKALYILLVWIGLFSAIQAQETGEVLIDLNLSEASFDTFAELMLKDYQIRFYYKPEWVKDIRISVVAKSKKLEDLLDDILHAHAINFLYQGKNQVFLTGTNTLVELSQLKPITTALKDSEAKIQGGAIDNFGIHSYEKKVRKVVVGGDNPSQGRRKVYITGRITNRSNGEAVVGATTFITGTNIGAISGADGDFSIAVQSGQTYNLQASCLGMENELYLLDVKGAGILNIELEGKMIDVKEVVVKSGKNHNVRGMQMGFQRIGMKEIKSIPAVMGERDIFKVATLMPGVQTVGEGSAGFNVRGSASDQNLFLLNDIPVLNTGHLFGFFSAFNPDMVSDFNLYKSNFPVEYGGRLASVFEISTRKGNKKEFGARGSISPVTASLLLETPIKKDKSSFIISTRSTYSDWILNRLDDSDLYNREANFYDIMTGLHLIDKHNGSTQIFGYYSKDKFRLSDSNQYGYENLGASISYNRPLQGKWHLNAAGVFSRYTNYQANMSQETRAFEHQFNIGSQELKVNFTGYPWARHKIGFGGNAILHNLNQGVLKPYGDQSIISPIDFGKENGLEYAVNLFDEISLTDKLSFYGGLRYSFFNYLGPNNINGYLENRPYETENITDTTSYSIGESIQHYSGPEFRAALNYVVTRDFSIKASYNRMRQYLFMLSNSTSISPTDRWKLTDPYITPPISDQLSLGLYKNYNNSSVETSAEIYYKKGQNIIEYKDGVDLTFSPDIETLVLQGLQKAYGVEVFIKRNTGRLNGWLSYSYSRSIIQVDGTENWQKINMGLSYPANYDKPHALNLVGNFKISRRLSISSNLVYNSGRPITYPTGYLFANNYQVVNYSLRNEYRIPDYFRIDLSLNIEGNLIKKKLAHSSWMFSVYNLTGRRNAYSVYFTNDRGRIKGYQLSIYGEPIFTISYNFKLGNYAVD